MNKIRERDILYETRTAWIWRDVDSYVVFVKGVSVSESCSSFPRTVDGLSLAICRVDYHNRKKVPHLPLLPTATALTLAQHIHR